MHFISYFVKLHRIVHVKKRIVNITIISGYLAVIDIKIETSDREKPIKRNTQMQS